MNKYEKLADDARARAQVEGVVSTWQLFLKLGKALEEAAAILREVKKLSDKFAHGGLIHADEASDLINKALSGIELPSEPSLLTQQVTSRNPATGSHTVHVPKKPDGTFATDPKPKGRIIPPGESSK